MMNTYDHPEKTFPPQKILFPQTREPIDEEDINEDLRTCIEHGTVAVYDGFAYATMLGVWTSAMSEN